MCLALLWGLDEEGRVRVFDVLAVAVAFVVCGLR